MDYSLRLYIPGLSQKAVRSQKNRHAGVCLSSIPLHASIISMSFFQNNAKNLLFHQIISFTIQFISFFHRSAPGKPEFHAGPLLRPASDHKRSLLPIAEPKPLHDVADAHAAPAVGPGLLRGLNVRPHLLQGGEHLILHPLAVVRYHDTQLIPFAGDGDADLSLDVVGLSRA